MKNSELLKDFPAYTDLFKDSLDLDRIVKDCGTLKTVDNLKAIFSLIDLTTLDVTDTSAKVAGMSKKVNEFAASFPEMPNVASICVYPALVETVKHHLNTRGVGITSVIGGFPASQTCIEVKELETEIAILDGATETDIVMSVGRFLEEQYKTVHSELRDIKELLGKVHLKVILETGALSDEQIYGASVLSIKAGADFIKTSTGKFSPAATVNAVYIMCHAIKAHFQSTGKMVGIKPAGGIATADEALPYYAVVKEVLGEAWLTPKYFRIGASRLANNLLEDIAKMEGKDYQPYF